MIISAKLYMWFLFFIFILGISMVKSILITQSLQNDFVKPIGLYDELPSFVHIGYKEAKRLNGENPAEGPLSLFMQWANKQSNDELGIIHIRDIHDASDFLDTDYLQSYRAHCVRDTPGAEFIPSIIDKERSVSIIDSAHMIDFSMTSLEKKLEESTDGVFKVGVIGAWTEDKIFFLSYELRRRFPYIEIAVCSALTASSTKVNHINALDQLERLLGVRIMSSMGEFTEYLTGDDADLLTPIASKWKINNTQISGIDDIDDTDKNIIRYLFRGSKKVWIKPLPGGYSGNLVLLSSSEDQHGHKQIPHVIKIGEQKDMGKERMAFEKVENILGDFAPQIADFADLNGRGGLKYRYAAMGGGGSSTFKGLFEKDLPMEKAKKFLNIVFKQHMGRFYEVATADQVNLLKYYGIESGYAPRMKQKIEKLIGYPADEEIIKLPTGQEFPNPYTFYSQTLEKLSARATGTYSFSLIHGDLNGSNILIDGNENVWIIDFFSTERGHVIKDLIKFENDLLYFFTPVNNEDDLKDAIKLTDILLKIEDLDKPLPPVDQTNLNNIHMRRSYEVIRQLRSFYPDILKDSRNIIQLLIGQLRYAGRTLTYFESNEWQKLWALYVTGHLCKKIEKKLESYGPLRIGWIDEQYTENGKMGLTILPGRKDRNRSLSDDITSMKEQGVSHVITLLSAKEFIDYGVEGLLDKYNEAGLKVKYLPILDHSACSVNDMDDIVEWISENLHEGANIMVHCVGGLGRSGLVSGAYLISKGHTAKKAMRIVRKARSPKAIEPEQVKFLRTYAKVKLVPDDSGRPSSFTTFDDVLDLAIFEEAEAVKLYTQLAQMVTDPTTRSHFEAFTIEEEKHLAKFNKIKEEGNFKNFTHDQAIFDFINEDETLQEVVDLRNSIDLGPDISLDDAFRFVIIKEKGAYLIYSTLAENTEDPEIKELLEFFAMEEAKHKIQFEIVYEKWKKQNMI